MNNRKSKLIIGRLPFLVGAPFFHDFLGRETPNIQWIDANPAKCNNLLKTGKIHAAPASSIEYLRNKQLYYALGDICTGSTLDIKSVKLFSLYPLTELSGKDVFLTEQSETSVLLLKILLKHLDITPNFVQKKDNSQAQLLIGDQALTASWQKAWPFEYDLANLWQDWHHLPFVFGLWSVRKEAVDTLELAPIFHEFRKKLQKSINNFNKNKGISLQNWLKAYPSPIPLDELLSYYKAIEYNFSPEHKKSLLIFDELAQKHGVSKPGNFNFI